MSNFWKKSWLGILAALLVGLMALLLTISSRSKTAYQFEGFSKISVTESDPIVKATSELIDSFTEWLDNHPVDSVEDEALHKYLELHNAYAKVCRQNGIDAPIFANLNELNDGRYPKRMAKVKEHLRDCGWASNFVSPIDGKDSKGEYRPMSFVYLGRVHSRKSGTVASSEEVEIPYVVDMIERLKVVKYSSFTINSMTDGTHVSHFIESFERTTDRIVETLATEDRSNQEAVLYHIQWGDDQKTYGARSEKLRTKILSGLVNVSHSHELQHVRDHELIEEMDFGRNLKPTAKRGVQAFVEARGALRPVRDSNIPIYAIAHLLNWESSEIPVSKAAATIAFGCMGQPVLTDNREISTTLSQEIGDKGLKNSDLILAILKRNLNKPEPMKATMAEMKRLEESGKLKFFR